MTPASNDNEILKILVFSVLLVPLNVFFFFSGAFKNIESNLLFSWNIESNLRNDPNKSLHGARCVWFFFQGE